MTLSDSGQLIAMQGQSNLPHLLEHLSMLPFEPVPNSNDGLSPLRTWTDVSGQFEIRARLMLVSAGTFVLAREDGRLINVPADKMSQQDRHYVDQLEEGDDVVANPFK